MADKDLTINLKQALQGQPLNFVLAKGPKNVAMMLSKRAISPATEKELKSRAETNKIFAGVCVAEEGVLKLKSEDGIPSNWATTIKKYILAETKLTVDLDMVKVDLSAPIEESQSKRGDDVLDLDKIKVDHIDIDARKMADVDNKLSRMKDFLDTYEKKKSESHMKVAETENLFKKMKSNQDVWRKILDNPPEQVKETPGFLKQIREELEKSFRAQKGFAAAIEEQNKELAKIDKFKAEFEALRAGYDALLAQYKSKEGIPPDELRILTHPKTDERIKAVSTAMSLAFEKTDKRLFILGRLAQTIGDESVKGEYIPNWKDTLPDDGTAKAKAEKEIEMGRVLGAESWSMAVNDAFIKSGLLQKAPAAMVTNFQKEVQSKLKELLRAAGEKATSGKDEDKESKAEVKKELRAFVKKTYAEKMKSDPNYVDALYKGDWEKNNDGFAIYMIELEQLIDDGYVLMTQRPEYPSEADTSGQSAGSKGLDTVADNYKGVVYSCANHQKVRRTDDQYNADENGRLCPICGSALKDEREFMEQIMVPSGKGQKIKSELDLTVALKSLVGKADNKERINADAALKTQVGALVSMIKAGKTEDATAALDSLTQALAV